TDGIFIIPLEYSSIDHKNTYIHATKGNWKYDEYGNVEYGENGEMIQPMEGAFSTSGKIILECKYSSVSEIKNGSQTILAATKNGITELIDLTGKSVIAPFEGNIEPTNVFPALLYKDEKVGLMELNRIIVEPKYDRLTRVNPNLYIASSDDLLGAIDGSGKVIVPLSYTRFGYDGVNNCFLAGVGTVGVLSIDGKEIVPMEQLNIESIKGGKFAVLADEGWKIKNMKGADVLPDAFERVDVAGEMAILTKNEKIWIMLPNGKLDGPYDFFQIYRQTKDVNNSPAFIVAVKGGTELKAIRTDYYEAYDEEGFLLPGTENTEYPYYADSKFTVYSNHGKKVVENADRIALYSISTMYEETTDARLIDLSDSAEVLNLEFESDSIYPFFICRQSKWGYVDASGKQIIPCDYDSIEFMQDFVVAYKSGKTNLFNTQGKLMADFDHTMPLRNNSNWQNMALITNKGGEKYTVYSESGGYDYEMGYEYATQSESHAIIGGKFGLFIPESNNYVIRDADHIRFCITDADYKGLHNSSSNNLIMTDLSDTTLLSPNDNYTISPYDPVFFQVNGKWGAASIISGKTIVAPQYSSLSLVLAGNYEEINAIIEGKSFEKYDAFGKQISKVDYNPLFSVFNNGNFERFVENGFYFRDELESDKLKKALTVLSDAASSGKINTFSDFSAHYSLSPESFISQMSEIENVESSMNTIYVQNKYTSDDEKFSTMKQTVHAIGLKGSDYFDEYTYENTNSVLAFDADEVRMKLGNNPNIVFLFDYIYEKNKEEENKIDFQFNYDTYEYDMVSKSGVVIEGKSVASYSNLTSGNFIVTKNGMYGLMGAYGKMITGFDYEDLSTGGFDHTLIAKLNGVYGLIDENGKIILEPKFERIGSFSTQLFRCDEKDNQIGIIDISGKILLEAVYSEIPFPKNGCSRVIKEGKYGLINDKAEIIVPAGYEYISDYSDSAVVFYKNVNGQLLQGAMDLKGNILLKPEYTQIGNFDYRQGFWFNPNNGVVVEKNGKIGVVSFSTRPVTEIIPAEYSTIIHPNNFDVFIVSKGGKFGLMDEAGSEILPMVSDSIVPVSSGYNNFLFAYQSQTGKQTCTVHLGDGFQILPTAFDNIEMPSGFNCFRTLKEGKHEYYSFTGEPLEGIDEEWNNSAYKIFYNKASAGKTGWTATAGPVGCDATAFYIDKDGGYWLGTGSSGGVYFSSDKGKKWTERNNGIGPVHIRDMGLIRDSLFIWIADQTDSSFYFYDNATSIWRQPANNCNEYSNTFCHSNNFNELSEQRRTQLSEQFITDYISYYSEEGLFGLDYQTNKNDYAEDSRLKAINPENNAWRAINTQLPKDIYNIHFGGFFKLNENNFALLAKSGLYNLDTLGKKVTPFSEKGLVASDVRQIVNGEKGSFYALVGESAIWKLKSGKWSRVLSAYDEIVKDAGRDTVGDFAIRDLAEGKDGTVFFCFRGDVWTIKKGKPSIVLKKHYIDSLTIETMVQYELTTDVLNTTICHFSVAQGAGDTLWLVSILVADPDATEDFSDVALLSVFHPASGYFKTIRPVKRYPYPRVFSDKAGNIWLISNNYIGKAGSEVYPDNLTDFGSYQYEFAEIACSDDGKIAVLDTYNQKIRIWVPDKKAWTDLELPELIGISNLGFDKNGNLYAGTGLFYYSGCGGLYTDGKAQGLWKLGTDARGILKWTKIKGTPNQNILFIKQHPEGLLIGTSGSGAVMLKIE
ncbi:MAG: WG repeat-containing protein, partial [Bacteroidetes bacterium]|nr:WG repeat-containing protein [Bacteroidota bacterium]